MNPQEAWNIAFSQLEIQLARASFETWLRGAVFLGCAEDGSYRVGVANTYARDMLQHRAYRELQRAVTDHVGQPVELCFEVHRAAPDETVPLFKLLIEADQAEQEFYRNYGGKK